MLVKDKKEEFLGTKRILPTRATRVKKGSDPTATSIKLMLFGEIGSGKTFSIVGLLKAGYKVGVITTDVGGSGLLSVKLYLNNNNLSYLLENLREVTLENDDEVQDFMDKPEIFWPDIYDFDPDFLFWDGFSGWQQVDLSEKVGEMPVERKSDKELQPAVSSGLFFEQGQWGMMRNGTVRTLDKYCGLHNKKTGKIWHKIVTCQEGVKSKQDNTGQFYETKEPLLQGAGGVLSGAAFDLIIRTKKRTVTKGDKLVDEFQYQIKGENKKVKNRGFILDPVMEGNMEVLWGEISKQAGLKKDDIDPEKVKKD